MAEPDKEALAERLVELYSDKLLRLAYSILNSVPDAPGRVPGGAAQAAGSPRRL